MAYDISLVFSDRRFYFKLIETVLCLIGVVLMVFTARFFNKWIFELLLVGLGGYLIISLGLLLVIMLDYIGIFTEVLFAASGCIINMTGGIFTLIRFLQRGKFTNWFYIQYYRGDGNNWVELALGITVIVLAMVFLLDFFSNMREGLALSRGVSMEMNASER